MPGASRPKRSRDGRATGTIHPATSAFQLPGNGASNSMSSLTVARGGKGEAFKGEAPPPHARPLPLILSPSAFICSASSRVDNVCQRLCPEQIADRARCDEHESGKYEERDRQTGMTSYPAQILVAQERVLHIYAV